MKKLISVLLVILLCAPTVVFASSPSTWAEEEVNTARTNNLVIPESDGNFQDNITRELFCKLIVNMVEQTINNAVNITISNPFEDTSDNDIIKAYQLGIVKGISQTQFAPDNFITRQEVAVMMMRAARVLDNIESEDFAANIETQGLSFADQDSIASWAIVDVKEANKLGLMKGVGSNNIDPLGNTTVEQSLLLILRLYENFLIHTGSSIIETPEENTAPVPKDDPVEFTVTENQALIFDASDLATDADGDDLIISKLFNTPISEGAISALASGTGTIRWLSDTEAKYISSDVPSDTTEEFYVHVSDGTEEIRVNIKINIEAEIDSPLPIDETIAFSVNEQMQISIFSNDIAVDGNDDTLLVTNVTGAAQGTVAIHPSGDRFAYTSNNITKNIIENLIVTVTDGTTPVDIEVAIYVHEVGNHAPTLQYSGDYYVLEIPSDSETAYVDLADLVQDFDADDELSVIGLEKDNLVLTNYSTAEMGVRYTMGGNPYTPILIEIPTVMFSRAGSTVQMGDKTEYYTLTAYDGTHQTEAHIKVIIKGTTGTFTPSEIEFQPIVVDPVIPIDPDILGP